jgi:F0F1-type ATP synthase delta subunit
MKEKQYIKQLEEKLTELSQMLMDQSLYSFLSDNERKKLINILKRTAQNKLEYIAA